MKMRGGLVNKIKFGFGVLLVAFGAMAGAAEMQEFAIPQTSLDSRGGHIQGLAVSTDAVYVAQMTQILKLDWKGNELARRKVQSHTGDITWWNGELYAAVAVYPACKEGRIQVYDGDLNLVREKTIDRTVDGIVCLDGVLYIGMGSKTQSPKTPHRVNVLGRFDAKTLSEVSPRQDFDYGYKTRYGFQNIATDGRRLYATFYAVTPAPIMAVFDRSGAVVGTAMAGGNQGFDVLPDGKGLLVHRSGRCIVQPLPQRHCQ